ncbi:MAG: heptosyltransferase-2 [Planctomycetota bacterium]|jgi:heptosyltransferase-2
MTPSDSSAPELRPKSFSETSGRHLALRLPADLADVALCNPILVAAELDPRWDRVTVVSPYESSALLLDDDDASLTSGGSEIVRIGTEREESAALRRLAPDAIGLLDHGLRCAWKSARVGIPVRAGIAVGLRRWLLTHGATPPTSMGRVLPTPIAHLARDVGGLLGLGTASLHPRITFCEERAATAMTRLADAGVQAGHPFWLCVPAAEEGQASLWPIAHFAALIDRIVQARKWAPVLVAWTSAQDQLNHQIAEAADSECTCLLLRNRDLRLFAPLAARARAWVGGGAAPSALAATAGVPCLGLFGPTASIARTPVSAFASGLAIPELDCAPCLQSVCPLGHGRCLSELQPERVLASLIELIDDREAANQDPNAWSDLEGTS